MTSQVGRSGVPQKPVFLAVGLNVRAMFRHFADLGHRPLGGLLQFYLASVGARRTIEAIGQFLRQSIYRHGRLRAIQVNLILHAGTDLSLWDGSGLDVTLIPGTHSNRESSSNNFLQRVSRRSISWQLYGV